ncbi:immunoglobulin-binding protein 1-like [Panonychus citri]|uniref:immunoglobulin-binding protein 1-like n=1 Tax=Panonychus citri TaxID=50023 RepID=UPI002307C079|nr:immunoglobulin-binding protein 1-like [Panonychus citri]
MDGNESTPDSVNLSNDFDTSLRLIKELDNSDLPTNNINYQNKVKQTISLLERSTVMVNQLSLFSENETISDVASSSIKYLLLPALLGYLHMKLVTKDRLESLIIANIYFKDYLKRIVSYEVCPIGIDLDELEDGEEEEDQQQEGNSNSKETIKIEKPKKVFTSNSIAELQAMGRERLAKIENYRRQKEIDEKLESLEPIVNCNDGEDASDEQRREYFILLIKKWVSIGIEEMSSIAKEKEVLSLMRKMGGKKVEPKEKPKSEPIKPFIITRTELQKKVFGLGYPAIPTMSIEQFVDIKIKEGALSEQKPGQSNSLMDWAQNPDIKKQQDEDDAAIKEKAEDEEDKEALIKARGWDEFKDDNKRGWGNRYNRS